MRKKLFGFSMMASVGFLLMGTVTLTSCGDDTVFKAASVRLSANSLSMKVGEKRKLDVSVSPKSALSAELRWFSSDEKVCYVSEDGYVIATGEGFSTVTASIAGGYAECQVTVSGTGEGGGGEDVPYVVLNPTTKSIKEGKSFTISASVYPKETTVTYSVTGSEYVSVEQNGLNATVLAVKEGNAVITAQGSNGLSATCQVAVQAEGGDTSYDWGILKSQEGKKFSGSIVIGVTPGQEEFTRGLIGEFNAKTGSSISVTVTTWGEDKAAENIGTDPANAPHIYAYASDQTIRLNSRKALRRLGSDDTEWIEEHMGETATDYATLAGVNATVGYPFCSDNGYVMFYDKSLTTAEEISTIDKLFEKAGEYGYEVDYSLVNGFLTSGALMTYNNGKSSYTVTVDANSGTASAEANFNTDAGLKAAKVIANLYKKGITDAEECPGSISEVLATITDCSKVKAFKEGLGNNYGVAPLPYVSDTDHTRLGVSLGYKFYGINPQRAKGGEVEVCEVLSRFLTSEYVQAKRYQQFYTKPTVLNEEILELCAEEPHIAALNQQAADKGIIPLAAVKASFWDATMSCGKTIKTLVSKGEQSDETLRAALIDLNRQCENAD